MLVRPRIIPTLLIDEGNLYKTKQFKKPRYLGDPINAIKIFNEKCVDELCVLDIGSTKKKHAPNFELLKKMATEAFMPLSYGGGLATFDDIKRVFSIGFEKVVLNTALIRRQDVFREAALYFGSQSIIAAIDYKKHFGHNVCYIESGSKKVQYTPIELAILAEQCGAGEILLYSIDRDGMKNGYDIRTVKEVADCVNIPVVPCGGAGSIDDIKTILTQSRAHAVAAGSIFVYWGDKEAVLINYPESETLIQAGIYKEKM